MDSSDPGKYARSSRPQRGRLAWLVIGPLLVCAACAWLVIFSLSPLRDRLDSRRSAPPLPVTGLEETSEALPTPGAGPELPPGHPTLTPGQAYRFEAQRKLDACFSSFEELYMLEQMLYYEPAMQRIQGWIDEVRPAVAAFRAGCESLGSLPEAPGLYKDVDRWMKLAGGEASLAAESFNALLDGERDWAADRIHEHMHNFIDYTHKAQRALIGLEDRREL